MITCVSFFNVYCIRYIIGRGDSMTFADYMDTILSFEKREVFMEIIDWVKREFPQLELHIKWNQPMFLDHGTFIIAFSQAKKHISISPEKVILDQYIDRIKDKHTHTKMLFHLRWNQEIDFELLHDVISSSIEYKKDYDKFWL